MSEKLSQLSDRYHLALFWVRFLGSNFYSGIKGSRFNDLAKLWSFEDRDVNTKAMIAETLDDYVDVMQELLGDGASISGEGLHHLKRLVLRLLESVEVTRPTRTFHNEDLAAMDKKLRSYQVNADQAREAEAYYALEDAIHLIWELDLGLHLADADFRGEVEFWHNVNVGVVDKIAEQLYEAICGINKIEVRADHFLSVYQKKLGVFNTTDSRLLREVNLGRRHHYVELPNPRNAISKLYHHSLLKSRGVDQENIIGDTFREKITKAIPALLRLVDFVGETMKKLP